MNVLITVSLLSPALSQNISALNTLRNSYQNNYTVGFANNSCTRISMFKFPSLSSGIASFLTLQFLPQLQPLTTNISLSLFSFSNNQQVGSTITSSFNTNYLGTTDVSLANWNFTSGKLYYLTIQPTLTDYVKIPWGASSLSSTSVVLQQGSSCTTGQWTQYLTNNGAYIPVQIVVQSMVTPLITSALGNTATPNNTVSSLGNVSSTSSHSPTPSQTFTLNLVNSSTSSPSNTPSTTASPSNTPSTTATPSNTPSTTASPPITPTQTQTSSPSTTSTMTPSVSPPQTPTLKHSFVGTTSPSPSSSNTLSDSDSKSPSLTPTSQVLNSTGSIVPLFYQAQAVQSQEAKPAIIAFSFFGSVFSLLSLAFVVMYIRYLVKKPQSPVTTNPMSPDAEKAVSAQTISPLMLAMPSPNVWHAVTEGDETWYVNSKTNESVWFLPQGETVMD